MRRLTWSPPTIFNRLLWVSVAAFTLLTLFFMPTMPTHPPPSPSPHAPTPTGLTLPPTTFHDPPQWFDPPTRDRVYWLENVGRVASHGARVSWQVLSLRLPASPTPAIAQQDLNVSHNNVSTTQPAHAQVNCSMPANHSSLASCICPNPHMASWSVKDNTFPMVTLLPFSDHQPIASDAISRVMMPTLYTDPCTVVQHMTLQQRTMQAIYLNMASARAYDTQTAIAVYVAGQDANSAVVAPQTSTAVATPPVSTPQLAEVREVHDYLWQLSLTNQLWSHLPSHIFTSQADSTALVTYSLPAFIMTEDVCPMISSATALAIRPLLRAEVCAVPQSSTAVAVRAPFEFACHERACSADGIFTVLIDSISAVAGSVYAAELSITVPLHSTALPTPTLLTIVFFSNGEMTALGSLVPQPSAWDSSNHRTSCCSKTSTLINSKRQKSYSAFPLPISGASLFLDTSRNLASDASTASCCQSPLGSITIETVPNSTAITASNPHPGLLHHLNMFRKHHLVVSFAAGAHCILWAAAAALHKNFGS